LSSPDRESAAGLYTPWDITRSDKGTLALTCLPYNRMTHDAAPPNSSDAPIDWEALARYVAGESPAVEADRIGRWLAEHPGDADVVAALDNAMHILALRDAPEIDVEGALRRVSIRRDVRVAGREPVPIRPIASRSSVRRNVRSWRVVTLLASAAVVVLAARALLQRKEGANTTSITTSATKTYATAVGQRDSVQLPDGGRVILGPESRLTIAAGYGERIRQVELHGEAYFDIRHDTTRPFEVRLALAIVRDVGTAFVVHDDSARVRVVVTSGSVQLRAIDDTTHNAVLGAGDMGIVQADGRLATVRSVTTAQYLSWMQGSLVFRDATLDEVSNDLRRWYGVVLRVDDSTLARRHLTMSFNGDPIDRVLRVIGLGLGADVVLHGDTAVVRPSRTR